MDEKDEAKNAEGTNPRLEREWWSRTLQLELNT